MNDDLELRKYLRKHPEVVAALKGRAAQTEALNRESRIQRSYVSEATRRFKVEAEKAADIKPFLELEFIYANPYTIVGGSLGYRRWLLKQEKISLHVYMPTYLHVGVYK